MTFPYGLHLLHLLGAVWNSGFTEPLQATASGAWADMPADGAGDGGRTDVSIAPAGVKASAIANFPRPGGRP